MKDMPSPCAKSEKNILVSVPAAPCVFVCSKYQVLPSFTSLYVGRDEQNVLMCKLLSKLLPGKQRERLRREGVGVLSWSCSRNLEKRVRKQGWGGWRVMAEITWQWNKSEPTKTAQPERGIEEAGRERGHQIDNLARNLDTVRRGHAPD